jgi:exopolyphosphatase/guanosine-5'-triphosphate,3'-diphosphate pyrophosphatase
MYSESVAVIDLGSNSIKVLVAARGPDGRLQALYQHTMEARISAGIGRAAPRLSEEGMARGLAAVQSLVTGAAPFDPKRTVIVATSAVRDAVNGPEFRERIRAATGHSVRLLSGDEEASLIGAGLTCDPALAALRDYTVFDLGGGSLECLSFRDGKLDREVSLQLGCVRMMETFAPNPVAAFPASAAVALAAHVRDQLTASGFPLALPAGGAAIGTGGTFGTARAMLAARAGIPFDQRDPVLRAVELRTLEFVGQLPLTERRSLPGLPAGRADIFPIALVTVLTLAELGGYGEFRHSTYNLRWGVATELLGQLADRASAGDP